jgi:hypothetical protein
VPVRAECACSRVDQVPVDEVDLCAITGDDPADPEEKWLLDQGKKHPKANCEVCGNALAAEVNANVPEVEKHKAQVMLADKLTRGVAKSAA